MGLVERVCAALRDSHWSFVVHQGLGRITMKVQTEPGDSYTVVLHVREEACIIVGLFLYNRRCGPENCERMLTFVNRQNFDLLIGGFEMDVETGALKYRNSIDVESIEITTGFVDHFVRFLSAFGAKYVRALDAVLDGKTLNEANNLMS
jgi:hypothetical protein